MNKHTASNVPHWGYRGSGQRWRMHPPGRWWHRAVHKVNQHRETVDEILQSIMERDERDATLQVELLNKRIAEQKREAERLACENRTGTLHLSADGEYFCWHATLAIGPGMPQNQQFTMMFPTPEEVKNVPALLPSWKGCQHLNTEIIYETQDYYPSGQYGPVSRWPFATDIVDSKTVCVDCKEIIHD